MGEMIKVGMADMNVCVPPNAITTLGLGSCVGIVLYDPIKKICGMVHVMLPDSNKIRNNNNLAKFADTGIDELIRTLLKMGAGRSNLTAKIAGGAQMFSFSSGGSQGADMMQIGKRNVEATKQRLSQLKIPIAAEDTGANYGRTIEFYPDTGRLVIKSVGKPLKTL